MSSTHRWLPFSAVLLVSLSLSAWAESPVLPASDAKPLVNLRIEGGFSPVFLHLDVTVDVAGGVRAKGGGDSGFALLNPADLAALKRDLAAQPWSTFPAQMRAEPAGMDMPTDTIKYYGPGATHPVSLTHLPGGPKAPASLLKLVDLASALGYGAIGKDAPLLKLDVDVTPGADKAAFALHVKNIGARVQAIKIPNWGATRFLVKDKSGATVYDSEAHIYRIMIMVIPTLKVLKPGAAWTTDGSWDYTRNVWGSDDRSRVPGGTYKVQGILSAMAAPGGKMSSRWVPFVVPEDGLGKTVKLRLTRSLDKDAGTVALKLTVTNEGKKATTLKFDSFPTYAFEVFDAKTGKVVFRHADDVVIMIYPPPTPKPLKLEPGESKSFTTTWDFKDGATGKKLTGAFRASARLFTDPERKSNTVTFVYDPALESSSGGPGIVDALHAAAGS